MEVTSSLNKIRDMYAENIGRSGPVSTAVGWNTPESQALRFHKLTEVVEQKGQPVSINDYGCGYGAHLNYLLENGYQVNAYHGYDLSSEMLASARERHASFNGQLDLRESAVIETEADYTFVSGTFNVRFDATEEEWKAYILQKLEEIHCHSRRGFSFNLLSTYVDWKQPHLYYGDPLFWFDHCKKNFSRKVSLLHDYPLYEWTILVRK
jgi:SAM-dependent methyltransferase